MRFSKRQIQIICGVVAVALVVPIAISVIAMFVPV